MRKTLYAAAAAAGALGLGITMSLFAASPARTTIHPAGSVSAVQPDYVQAACGTPVKPAGPACMLLIDKSVKPVSEDALGLDATPGGLGAPDLQSAYNLPSATDGKGQTVAVIEMGDDPNLETDLGVYRAQYGLPACTTANGCFKKLNDAGQQGNYPPSDSGWAVETSLDVDIVSAICPLCNIDVIESAGDLDSAQNTAVAAGAHYISNSWGEGEFSGEQATDDDYSHPGVVDTVAAGDSGFGVSWPATATDVVAVGGTELDQGGGGSRGWTETAWNGSGGGCSQFEAKQSFQTTTDCGTMRTDNDVSAVASSNAGVAMYDTFDQNGWFTVGGTSVAAPLIASVYALAASPPATAPAASTLYANPGDLNDITSGSNGSCSPASLCNAGPGYDGVTGNGTPNGIGAFTAG